MTAKIMSRSFHGDMDPAEFAQPGDTIRFGVASGQNDDLLVVNMLDSEQHFGFCGPAGYDEHCGV